jgi:lipopolysaccharide export system protein LptC
VTFEAQLVPGDRRYRVRSAEEHEQAFSRAAQHSRIVAILRKTLPVMAVVVLASYFISTRLSVTVGGVTASVSGVEVNDGNLRMVNPTLKGMDKKNGAYVVSADYADQDMKNPKMIKLHAIKAELTTDQ